MNQTRLREVTSEDVRPQEVNQSQAAATQLLILALKTLSQRALLAIASIKGMLLAGTVFWLALNVNIDPTPGRLMGLGLYAAFILIVGYMDFRRR